MGERAAFVCDANKRLIGYRLCPLVIIAYVKSQSLDGHHPLPWDRAPVDWPFLVPSPGMNDGWRLPGCLAVAVYR